MNKVNQPDTFLRLRDTPDSYVAGQTLRVNGAGTGLEFSSPSIKSALPTPATAGMTASVTDGTAGLAWGATLTGGGGGDATKYFVWYNGTNWTVAGK